MKTSRIVTLALSLYFILIAVVVLQLRNSAVTGYELSIYANTPPLTWLLVVGSIITGLVIIVREVMSGSRGNRWLLGFFMLGVSVFIICALPTLRGYHLYNPVDPLGHLAMTQKILSTGHLGETNTYPLLHILLTETVIIGKAPLMLMIKYLPVLLSLAFMVYTYMLASTVLPKKGMALLAAAASATLLFDFFHVSPYPQGLATMTLPLVFYLYFKRLQSPHIGYSVAFVIFLVGYVFSHPHTVLVLIAFLITIEVGKVVFNRLFAEPPASQLAVPTRARGISFTPVLILFVTFFTWISVFAVFNDRVKLGWQVLTGQVTEMPPQLAWIAPAIQVQGWDFVQFVLRQYGGRLIYMTVAVIGMLLILRHVRQRQPGLRYLWFLVVFIPIGELVGVVFYRLTMLSIPARLLESSILLTLAAVVLGYILYKVLQPPGRRRIIKMAVPVVIIALAATLSVFSTYRSPLVYQANPMATRMDEYGTSWLVSYKKLNLQINGLGSFRSWLIPAVGWEEVETGARRDISASNYRICVRPYHKIDLPPHLSYLTYNSIGDRYQVEGEWETATAAYGTLHYVRYVVVTDAFNIVHSDAALLERRVVGNQEVGGRWDIEVADIERLGEDPAVAKIYANGGYDIYFVCPYAISPDDPILASDSLEETIP